MIKKLKDLKKFIITVPKDYIVDKNSFLSKQTYLFAREDELDFFKQRNKNVKCCLIKDINSDDIIVLNNKIAYYLHIYKKLKHYKKVYYYNFFELNLLGDGDINVVEIESPYFVENFTTSVFYDLIENKIVFIFYEKNKERCFSKIDLINKIKKNGSFVLIPPGGRVNAIDYSLIRIAKYLKSKDKKVIFLALKNSESCYRKYFDEIYLEDNFIDFFKRLNSIEKEYIFYRGWMHEYLFGALLSSKFKNVLVYLKDWNFASKEEYSFLFENGEDDFYAIEKIFKNAKYVLSHFTKEESDKWVKEYSVNKDKFIFFPEYCNNLDIKIPKDRDKNSLVWAGTVPPSSFPAKFYISKDMLKAIKEVSKQQIKIDFVIPPKYYESMIDEQKNCYIDILYENKFNKFFNLKKGAELSPEIISMYGYGIFPLYIEEDRNFRLFKYAVPSKLAFYLEANLPIIVNEKMKAVSKIVKENGIGIVISNDDLKNIKKILKENEKYYNSMLECVKIFKYKFSYKNLKKIFKKEIE